MSEHSTPTGLPSMDRHGYMSRGTSRRILVLGGGGNGSDVLTVIEAQRAVGDDISVMGILDDDPSLDCGRFIGRASFLGPISLLDCLGADGFVLAMGWPHVRRAVAARLANCATPAVSLTHPSACLATGVILAPGAVVLAMACVSALVRVGAHAVVSNGAIVGHDTVIGSFSSVMPGAVLSGDVHVGSGVLIGTNATVLEGRCIGDGARIGAGAVVTKDVASGVTVVGVPARVLSSDEPGRQLHASEGLTDTAKAGNGAFQ